MPHHGAGLPHPPRGLAGRYFSLYRRREGVRRGQSRRNRAPHIDPWRPGAACGELPSSNRRMPIERGNLCDLNPNPHRYQSFHTLLTESLACLPPPNLRTELYG